METMAADEVLRGALAPSKTESRAVRREKERTGEMEGAAGGAERHNSKAELVRLLHRAGSS